MTKPNAMANAMSASDPSSHLSCCRSIPLYMAETHQETEDADDEPEQEHHVGQDGEERPPGPIRGDADRIAHDEGRSVRHRGREQWTDRLHEQDARDDCKGDPGGATAPASR